MKTLWIPSLLGAASLTVSTLTSPSVVLAPDGTLSSADEPSAERTQLKMERVVRRANTFTDSSQDGAALAADSAGNWTIAWHSKRQEGGGYGICARRFGPTGEPLSGEQPINETVDGMQMQPCLATDDQGGTWFAWRSFGQDGDRGTVVARRFDAQLERATGEQIVNESHSGHQSDPSIAALPDGGALIVWMGSDSSEHGTRIYGRCLGADGAPQGPEFQLGQSSGRDRFPHVATDSQGRAIACWARTSHGGVPLGIFAQVIGRSGLPVGDEFRVDPNTSLQPVEPTISMNSHGLAAIAWLDLSAVGAPLMWRGFEWDGGQLEAGTVHEHVIDEPGYTNGHAVDLSDEGSLLLSWSRRTPNDNGAHLFAQVVDRAGLAQAPAFPVHGTEDGFEQFAVGRGTSRVLQHADGPIGFAWNGDGGLGDSSAVHLSILLPDGFQASDVEQTPVDESVFDTTRSRPAPHERPTFDPRRALPQPPTTQAPLLGPTGTFDYLGITDTGAIPPDPHIAVSHDHLVQVTNGEVQFRDLSGTLLYSEGLNGNTGFWGPVGTTNVVIDPEALWDPHAQRFMIMAAELNISRTVPYYVFAVSDDADPMGTWHKYRINVLASAGDTDIDSPNMAVDEDVVYLSADFSGPDTFHILMIDKSSVLGGGTIAFNDAVLSGKHSFGMPITHDVGAPAQYLIYANDIAGSNQIEFRAITDALTTPVIQTTSLTLPTVYTPPENVPQLGTSTKIEIFGARFWSCVYRNGSLWATHHSGVGRAVQLWYQFDMQGWPGSGMQPVLVQSGSIDLGTPIRTFFGSIGVDANDNMALVFARSSPDEFVSMGQVTRGAGDPLGSTQPPITIITSTGTSGGRWGDYSGCVADPDELGVFWGCHEYTNGSNWFTRIARFEVCPLGEPYCISATHSGGQEAQIGNAGSPRIVDNEFFLTIQEGPPSKFGVFFYGPNMIQVPFGDGYRCVGGQTQRLNPTVMTSASGTLTKQIDLTTMQTMPITPASTWNFQFWFRDPMGPGGTGFNLSDALSVTFCE